MSDPKVTTLIRATTLRFSLWENNIVYHVASHPEAALDGMDELLQVDVAENPIFDCNLGFLPVCNTVLIQGEKNIIVDPGNAHLGFYGILARSLRCHGLKPADIDTVVLTHSHGDHMICTFLFERSRLVVGEGELEEGRANAWPEYVDAHTVDRVQGVDIVPRDGDGIEIMKGVSVLPTPGHTTGSVSVLVTTGEERVAILGDTAMTRADYELRKLSHWYTPAQREGINKSLDKVRDWRPTLLVPGHAEEFRPDPKAMTQERGGI